MDAFAYRDEKLFCEDVDVNAIAEHVGTPLYIYSANTMLDHLDEIKRAWQPIPHMVLYSVKANSNVAVIRLLAEQGAGTEVVSQGELFRCLRAGVDPRKIVFTGVGKTAAEIEYALREGVFLFVVESLPELFRLNEIAARLNRTAQFAIRVNPDVAPSTHPHITTGKATNKFGLDRESALEAYRQAKDMPHVSPLGIHMHIGSQILSSEPYVTAIRRVLTLIQQIGELGIELNYFDLGGGMGVVYEEAQRHFTAEELAGEIIPLVKDLNMTVILEPGRSIVADAGALITRVQYLKETPVKKFIVVDAGMNDLIRPALYGAYHRILSTLDRGSELIEVDIVGPLCESGDSFAENRRIPSVEAGDCLAILTAGAYASSMSSEYNSRPRCPEVLVRGGKFFIIRERAKLSQLVENERMPDFLSQFSPTKAAGEE